jgi:alkylation response protein AidB-like acyl-CoA dehydrogenase
LDFTFTETQTLLRDSLGRWLGDAYTFDHRMKALAGPGGRDPGMWAALASELGILGAPFAEEYGGLGGNALDSMVVMEELGKAIAVEPYIQTVVIAGGALAAVGGAVAASVIPEIIEGKAIIGFAYAEPQGRYNLADLATTARRDGAGWVLNGHKAVVIAAPYASHLLVTARTGGSQREPGGISLFLVDASAKGIVRRDYPTVDGFMASEVFFENAAIGEQALLGSEGGALPLIEELVDRATAALCAEATGVMRRLQEATLDYARQRTQFGQPIARFQVLQHRMVDMFMEVEQASSMTLQATLRLDLPAAERAHAVAQAKVKIARGARFTGQNAVQIHGGIGVTNELAVGHYFKRATMIESQFGDADHYLAKLEAALV